MNSSIVVDLIKSHMKLLVKTRDNERIKIQFIKWINLKFLDELIIVIDTSFPQYRDVLDKLIILI